MKPARINHALGILLVALALGISYDLLFWRRAVGLSFPLWVALVVGGLFLLARGQRLALRWGNVALVGLPLVAIAAMVAVRANVLLTVTNIGMSLLLLGLLAHYLTGGQLAELGVLGYPAVWAQVGLHALGQAAALLAEWRKTRTPRAGRSPWPVVRGLLLALPVVGVFASLLAAADPVFGRLLLQWLQLKSLGELLQRAVVVLCVSWGLAGALGYALGRRQGFDAPGLVARAADAIGRGLALGFTEAVVVLGSVDLLFGAFVGVQFAYFFGGQANITLEGFTYAEYARRGFGELLAVSILSLCLILGLRWLARRESRGQTLAFNALSTVLAGLVVVILVSAFQRLRLYEWAYGFTQIRLWVYVFMGWLGALLLWFIGTLWLRPERFALGVYLAAIGFVVTLNVINPDAFIARQNLARYRAGSVIDEVYLTTLSVDAAPVLSAALPELPDHEREVIAEHLDDVDRVLEVQWNAQGWPSWNWARAQALRGE